MPRIFKGSESTLRLLISKTGDYQALTGIKIKLYTTDIENAIEIIDGIQVCKNIAIITLAPRAFMGMEDGLINYIIDGATEDDVFHTERQSNYMLKSLSYINEDGVASQTMTIESNGGYRVTPNDGLYVDINVNVPDLNGSYDDGFNVGYGQGKTDGANEQKSKLVSINITENGTYTKEDGYNEIVVEVPDLNGDYNEGYEQGKAEQKSKLESINITENGIYSKEDGYNHIEVNVPDLNGSYDEGKTDGVNEQKGKLTQIRITENGTYTKEDGYSEVVVDVPDLNGSYDEGYTEGEHVGYNSGYTQGQADVAANARVLNVTENGNYLSKFSESIIPTTVTGVYADDTEFYSYALISNIIYSTGIIPNQNTRLEFWFKPYGTEYESWEIIIGSQRGDDTTDTFQVRRYGNTNDFVAEIGTSEVQFTMSENEWHHIIMSVADGFVLDGTKIGDFTENMTESNTPLQIGGTIFFNGQRTEEGYYGMIKIDDNIIIPTENGFKNVTTGQILQILKDGSYTYTENLPIYGEGELYKTINVNVIPKVNVQKAGLKFSESTFTKVPEWADFEGITDMSSMFRSCQNLQTIPLIDTSSVTTMERIFYTCDNLKTLPNNLNFGSCTNFSSMFNYTPSLTDYSFLETWVFNPNASMDNMINNTNITYVPAIPCVGNTSYYQSAIFWTTGNFSKLTYFGGWIGRKYNINKDNMLKKMPNLTYESCISILNNLYDFTGNGETPNSDQGQLKVHQNFLDTVGEEISIGTNKGWQITV